jgi:hypothetical protein
MSSLATALFCLRRRPRFREPSELSLLSELLLSLLLLLLQLSELLLLAELLLSLLTTLTFLEPRNSSISTEIIILMHNASHEIY